jgi:ArsR family transcriptional regulator, lead/cadmium/zinc/bismuth-responsive transcriptional repressor
VSDDRCDLLCLDLPRAEELRKARLDRRVAEHLADGPKALSDATRLTLVVALRDGGELCVCDLSWVVERPRTLSPITFGCSARRASCVLAETARW